MNKLVESHLRGSITKPAEVCTPPDMVYTFVLASDVEQTLSIPSDASFMRIKRGPLKKEYNADVYVAFGDTPIVRPTVSGYCDPPCFGLATIMETIDIRKVNGTLRVISDEAVKVQVCFFE
jgi:hypothetical protein